MAGLEPKERSELFTSTPARPGAEGHPGLAAGFDCDGTLVGALLWRWPARPACVYGAMLGGTFGTSTASPKHWSRPSRCCWPGLASVSPSGCCSGISAPKDSSISRDLRDRHRALGVAGRAGLDCASGDGAGRCRGGALWGLIPGALRAYLEASEIITSLMLNYVAILLADTGVRAVENPQGMGFPARRLPPAAWLPRWGTTRVHLGLVLGCCRVAICSAAAHLWGYEIRVIGENEQAARYAGITINRNILLVMALSGGLAGMAGMSEVAGLARAAAQPFTRLRLYRDHRGMACAAHPPRSCSSPFCLPDCSSAATSSRSAPVCRRRSPRCCRERSCSLCSAARCWASIASGGG